MPLRIAHVAYLNTEPLIRGLEKLRDIQLISAIPARIASLIASDAADIGLVSLIDIAHPHEPPDPHDRSGPQHALALLPVGMIGCDGPTLTVRLFSRIPLDQIRTLHADEESHTSTILARLLLARLYNAPTTIIPFRARSRAEWPDAILLIGDKVVAAAPPAGIYPHQLDLGDAWKRLTGLPFVYAVWMCRADRADSPRILAAAALLDRQRRHNATRLDWIIARRAPVHRWPIPLADRYLRTLLRFDVGPRERLAVERFLAEAAALNLAPTSTPFWADTRHQPSL